MSGKVVFESMRSDNTMLGYFVGADAVNATLKGDFSGYQGSLGASAGGYLLHAVNESLYLDGFATVGINALNLNLSNDVLVLDSSYKTMSYTVGVSMTGVLKSDSYEIWPQLAVSYGRTDIGNVGFTGVAFGLTDNNLSLDAGSVELANLSFTPEFRIPLGSGDGKYLPYLLTIAPRLICESVRSTAIDTGCGTGGALGISSSSLDGATQFKAAFQYDVVGNTSRQSTQMNWEHSF